MPNIYLGGNGSRILHWLANGDFTLASENKEYLKDIIFAASGFDLDAHFNLKITPKPKHEAAAGLLERGTTLKTPADEFGILAGEDFTEDEKDYSWTTLLTSEVFGNHLKSKYKLGQIENFISTFNTGIGKALGAPINLDPKLKKNLTSGLNDWFKELALQPDNERVVEPIYIMALGILLKQKTEQWLR